MGLPSRLPIHLSQITPVEFLWTGHVTTTTAVVAVKATGTSVRLQVSTSADFSVSPVFGSSATLTNAVAKPTITGLTAGTRYYYRVEVDGTIDTTQVGSFKTAPSGAANFTFLSGSCLQSNVNSTAVAKAAARNADFFLMTGDLGYWNIATNDQAAFRTAYDAQQATNLADLLAGTPTYYRWSNHDSDNFGTGTMLPAAAAVYRERVPHPTLPDASATYQAFTYGRVHFIIPDERMYASAWNATDDTSKTKLGATQKQWLKDEVTNSTSPLIVLVLDTVWTATSSATDENGWGLFQTERAELVKHFRSSGKNIYIIHGDQHCLAADDGGFSPGFYPVASAAPLSQAASMKADTFSQGYWPNPATGTVETYGHFTVTDDGVSNPTVAFTGYDGTDTSRVTLNHTAPTIDPVDPKVIQTREVRGAASSTSVTAALRLAPTTGNLLVAVAAGDKNTGTGSITGFTKEVELTSTSTSLYVFWKVSDGTEQSITMNHSLGGVSGCALYYMEIEQTGSGAWGLLGKATSITSEANVASQGTGTTPTLTGDGIALAAVSKDTFVTADRVAWGNGFDKTLSTYDSNNNDVGLWVGRKAVDSGATTSSTATLTGTSDQMSGAVVAFGRAPSGTPATGTGSLSLSASGAAQGSASGTGSLSLTASGAARGSASGTAALSLSAQGAAAAPATAAATLALTATGTAGGRATGSASLSLTAAGSARGSATGSASLALSASGTARAASSGTASLSLTASGTAQVTATGSASLALSASGAAAVTAAGSASLALSASGTAVAPVTGTATLSLTASGAAVASASGAASLSLSATGTATSPGGATGTASLSLTAAGSAQAVGAGSASLSLSANGTGRAASVGTATLSLAATGGATVTIGGTASLTITAVGAPQAALTGTATLSITATGTATGGEAQPHAPAAAERLTHIAHEDRYYAIPANLRRSRIRAEVRYATVARDVRTATVAPETRRSSR